MTCGQGWLHRVGAMMGVCWSVVSAIWVTLTTGERVVTMGIHTHTNHIITHTSHPVVMMLQSNVELYKSKMSKFISISPDGNDHNLISRVFLSADK